MKAGENFVSQLDRIITSRSRFDRFQNMVGLLIIPQVSLSYPDSCSFPAPLRERSAVRIAAFGTLAAKRLEHEASECAPTARFPPHDNQSLT